MPDQGVQKNKSWWLQLLIAALAGGAITAGADFAIGSKQLEYGAYESILKRLDQENIQLRQDNDILRDKVGALQKDVTEIQTQVLLLESSQQDLPFPMWIKSINGRMLSLNKSYESMFLKPMGKTSRDYIGKFDHEIWSAEIADKSQASDMKVIMINKKVIEEIVVNGVEWTIIKFGRRIDKTLVGVMGVAIPKDIKIILHEG